MPAAGVGLRSRGGEHAGGKTKDHSEHAGDHGFTHGGILSLRFGSSLLVGRAGGAMSPGVVQ